MGTEMDGTMPMQGISMKIYPFLGPAFLVSMGYIDPAKWVTTIEGGSRFGVELVWLLMLSNVVAILCQSLASRIGVVTGKHLAQICGEEYSRPVCMLLWLQCEASVIVLDLTVILGTAIGINLLLELDMFVCVILSTVDALLFPLILPLLGKRQAELLSISITGLVVLFFAPCTLSMQSNAISIVNGMTPKVKRESLYTAVSLLGANIMPYNFYLHSSIVQEQKNVQNIPNGVLCHYNVLEIAFAFGGILLVNLAVLSTAAITFHNAGLEILTFQDMQPLTEQIFKSSVARVAFFLAVFCASQLTKLTRTIGGKVALEGFLGINQHMWFNRILMKAGGIALAMLYVWNSGTADIYQLLIFSQVLLAMQLPAAVIPLFRVASSSSVMGTHKISLFVEVLAWLSFFFMVILNISLVLDMSFGDSEWIGSLRNIGAGMAVPFILILMFASLSLGFMLWLIATPLRCANQKVEVQRWFEGPETPYEHTEHLISRETVTYGLNSEAISEAVVDTSESKGTRIDKTLPVNDLKPGKDLKICSKDIEVHPREHTVLESGLSSAEIVPDIDFPRLPDVINVNEFPFVDSQAPLNSFSTESSLASIPAPSSDGLCTDSVPNVSKPSRIESEISVLKETELELDTEMEKYDDDGDGWEHEEVPTGLSESAYTLTHEEPGSCRSIGGRSDDGGSGSGSLSRLSGLGRAARRQFASILDEFWGKLFDFHGQLTEQARLKRLDLALGIKVVQTQGSVTSNGTIGRESKYLQEQEKILWQEQEKILWQKGQASEHLSVLDSCIKTSENLSGMDSSTGAHIYDTSLGSWASPMALRSSYARQVAPSFNRSERRYSRLHIPSYPEEFDYQPATIHGYQTTSYMGRSGTHTQCTNALDSQIGPQAGDISSFSMHDSFRKLPVGYGFSKLQEQGSLNTGFDLHGLQESGSSYNNSFSSRSLLRSHGNGQYTGQTKKYHSLPDISGHGLVKWDSPTGQERDQWNPSVQRAAGELDMRYRSLGSSSFRTDFKNLPVSQMGTYNDDVNNQVDQVPLSFDELSPSQLHKDGFSLQSTSKAENNSLWSRQPFEQLFGMSGIGSGRGYVSERNRKSRTVSNTHESVSCGDSEVEMLQNLRCCIVKLLRLEGSEWLFNQDGGFDEELIDLVAAREKFLHEADTYESSKLYNSDAQNQRQDYKFAPIPNTCESASVLVPSVPHCGEECVWVASLLVSFGIWCIHRILNLSLMESRPELWGKYTYVLNRLQGILEPAFCKPRLVLLPCFCLQIPLLKDAYGRKMAFLDSTLSNEPSATSFQNYSHGRAINSKRQGTSASAFLEIIKDVEIAVGSRKGRTGTAAGDVAFPKGKENLASVLKRYKRRLANKPPGILENNGGRRKVHG